MTTFIGNNFTTTIYKYYEPGVRLIETNNVKEVVTDNYSYECKCCKKHNILNAKGKPFTVNGSFKTSSNLKAHLKKNGHEEVFEAYQKEIEVNATQSTKRKIDFESSPLNSPSSKQSKLSGVSTAPKYGTNSLLQRSRYLCF